MAHHVLQVIRSVGAAPVSDCVVVLAGGEISGCIPPPTVPPPQSSNNSFLYWDKHLEAISQKCPLQLCKYYQKLNGGNTVDVCVCVDEGTPLLAQQGKGSQRQAPTRESQSVYFQRVCARSPPNRQLKLRPLIRVDFPKTSQDFSLWGGR